MPANTTTMEVLVLLSPTSAKQPLQRPRRQCRHPLRTSSSRRVSGVGVVTLLLLLSTLLGLLVENVVIAYPTAQATLRGIAAARLRLNNKAAASSSSTHSTRRTASNSTSTTTDDVPPYLTYSSSNDILQHGVRVLIDKFDVLLSFHSQPYSELELSQLHTILEQVLESYMDEQLTTPSSSSSPPTLNYVLLGAITSEQETVSTTRVMLGKGIVNFNATSGIDETTSTARAADGSTSSGANIPSRYQVNAWVKDAIDTKLLEALLNSNRSSFTDLSQATYVPLVVEIPTDDNSNTVTDDTTNATTDDRTIGGIGKDPTSNTNTSQSSSTTVILVCAILGAAVVMLVVGMFTIRQRRRKQNRVHYVEQRNPAYSVKEMIEDHPDDPTHSLPTEDDIYYDNHNQGREGNDTDGDYTERRDKFHPDGDNDEDDLNTTKETIASNASAPSPSPHKKNTPSKNHQHGGLSLLVQRKSSPASSRHNNGSDVDGRSLAGESESDFTVNTEAGDSTALKSLSHSLAHRLAAVAASKQRSSSGNPDGTVTSNSSVVTALTTESFERQRPPVSLQKDMLTSSWSGRVKALHPHELQHYPQTALLRSSASSTTNNGGGGSSPIAINNGPAAQTDSVLLPSHFNAAEERQQRYQTYQAQHTPPRVSPPRSNYNNDRNESADTSFSNHSVTSGSEPSGGARTDNTTSDITTYEDNDDTDDDTEESTSATAPITAMFQQAFGGSSTTSSQKQNRLTVEIPPQTPPSQTARNRFFGPRPSPGNIV